MYFCFSIVGAERCAQLTSFNSSSSSQVLSVFSENAKLIAVLLIWLNLQSAESELPKCAHVLGRGKEEFAENFGLKKCSKSESFFLPNCAPFVYKAHHKPVCCPHLLWHQAQISQKYSQIVFKWLQTT